MKNILAENLLRFGVKNINHVDKAVIEHLAEIAPGGAATSAAAQAQIDKLIAATNAPVSTFITQNKITFQTPGDPLVISSAKIGSAGTNSNADYDLYIVLNSNFSKNPIYLYLQAVEGGTMKLGIGNKVYAEIDKTNVWRALRYTWGTAGSDAIGLDKYLKTNHPVTKELDAAGKNPLDLIVKLINIVVDKWKSGTMATAESYYNHKNRLSEVNPGGAGSFDQGAMDKMIAETKAIAAKYINSTLKLDVKGGGPISVRDVNIVGRSQSAQGGIAVEIEWNIKDGGLWFERSFPIYSADGVKPAGYYGKDTAAGKTAFDTQFAKTVGQYFATSGPNYIACRDGIWNGIVAVADKYTKTGVATKG